jgi:murein L,D-transpeptidase YcbB/YkuD
MKIKKKFQNPSDSHENEEIFFEEEFSQDSSWVDEDMHEAEELKGLAYDIDDDYDNLWDDGWDAKEHESPEDKVKDTELSTASKAQISPGTYTVEQGDCMSSVAYRAGFFSDALWNHPKNSELKKKRKNPNALLRGDKVFIPEKRIHNETGATEKRHRFRRKGVPSKLHIRLLDVEGKPRTDVEYMIDIDGETRNGKTDQDGMIDESISPDAVTAKLVIDPEGDMEEYDLALGGIDPIDEISGTQSRLKNLGYLENLSCELDEETKSAISRFQKEFGLNETGEIDSATQAKLESYHDM